MIATGGPTAGIIPTRSRRVGGIMEDAAAPQAGNERFPAREEIIGELEEYLKELEAEVKGVEEHIADLKKEARLCQP
jgi:hypothetical protein